MRRQRARDVAGADGHGRAGDDGADRGNRIHEEGDGHQKRRRHGCRQPRHGADEQSEQRRQEDDQKNLGIEEQDEGAEDIFH